MSVPSRNPERQIIKNVDVAGQRINLWRPRPLADVLPFILDPTDSSIFIPQFDVMGFTLPQPDRFRSTDVYSDDQLRGFRRKGGIYEVIVGDDADYVLYRGRVGIDTIEDGVALPRDSRFVLLQTYLTQKDFEQDRDFYQEQRQKKVNESTKHLTNKDLKDQSGNTRLV